MLKVSETSSERKALISDCYDFKMLRFYSWLWIEGICLYRPTWIYYKNANFKLRLEFDKYSTKWKMQFFPENSNLCIGQRQTNLICHETPLDPSIVSCAGIHNFILSRTQHSSDFYSVQRGETRLGFEMFVLCGLDINMKYELENCLICLTCHATKRHWPGLPPPSLGGDITDTDFD